MDAVMHVMDAHVTVFVLGVQQTQTIKWEFHRSDPYAVHMLAPGPFEDIEWVFSRSILSDALAGDEPLSGEGDVTAAADAAELILYLTSPEGTAALIFAREEMEAFLTDTYKIIPDKGEADALGDELSDFLADVLGYAPTETVDDSKPLPGPTKTLVFGEMSYTVPLDSPEDLAEWEAELLDSIYREENPDQNEEL